MSLYFATCDVNNALKFLQNSFPDKNLTKESAPKFFEAVRKDYFRVCDPEFHAKGMVIGGNNFDGAPKDEVKEAQEEIQTLLY